MPDRPTRLVLVAERLDDSLQQLLDRAREWGGDRFQVELHVAEPGAVASDLQQADLVLALDAKGLRLTQAQQRSCVDLSGVPVAGRPQQVVQQMRGLLGAAKARRFNSDDDVQIEARLPIHDGFVQMERIDFRHRLHTGGWSPVLHRETMHRCPAVGVLPYDPHRDEVLLIEQIRIAAIEDRNGPWLLELIAGLVEPGEQPEQVCIRESLEEAGVQIGTPQLIADYLPSTGISDEQMLVYVAPFEAGHAGGIHGLIEEGEDIRVLTMSSAEAFELLANGCISNAATIIALQWLMLNIERLRKEWAAY